MSTASEVKIISEIQHAFPDIEIPIKVVQTNQLDKYEKAELTCFVEAVSQGISCSDLALYSDVIFWLSPSAFKYYLPTILSVGIKGGCSDLLIYDSIIGMLDRTPNPEYWDKNFLARWLKLNKPQCEAVRSWVIWLAGKEPELHDAQVYDRALTTLELLTTRKMDEQKTIGSGLAMPHY